MSDDQPHRALSGDEINALLDAVMLRELGEPGSEQAKASIQRLVDSGVIRTTRPGQPESVGDDPTTSD